jgi:hypothetical protein
MEFLIATLAPLFRGWRNPMPPIQPILVYLLAFNALFGLLIGAATARVPAFTTLGMPSFLWLVAGLFAFEVGAGLIFKTHPSALLTMPWRAAGLAVSFVCCYTAIALLS